MAKAKEIKLPKYLKLNKGAMWFDTDKDDPKSSGIRLINTDVKFVGRGCLSNTDMEQYRKTGITPKKPIAKDIHKNEETTHNSYGYVIEDKDQSYFCTDEVPKDKLGNILTAYNNNILVRHNPRVKKKPAETREINRGPKNFEYQDGDVVFIGTNKEVYNKLNNLTFKDLAEYIKSCDSRQNIQDMMNYEIKGYNRLSRARFEVLDLLKKKLKKLGGGISAITVNDIDDKDVDDK
jgi:hypothetical protein